jgi:hypothetical protein
MAGEHSSSQAPLREGWSTDTGHRNRAAGTVSSRAAGEHVAALDSDIRLTLPARPENVAVVVRHAGSRLIMSFLRARAMRAMGFA